MTQGQRYRRQDISPPENAPQYCSMVKHAGRGQGWFGTELEPRWRSSYQPGHPSAHSGRDAVASRAL